MKIRTSLFLLSTAFIILIAAIGLITFRAFRQIDTEVEEGSNVSKLIKDILELDIVTYEFLTYHEKRMLQQWTLRYDSVGVLLQRMREKELHPECLPALRSAASDYEALGDLFSQLHTNFARRKRLVEENGPEKEISLSLALEERIVAQALIRSQKITSAGLELSAVAEQAIEQTQQRVNSLVLFSVIGMIIFSACISFLTVRGITRPINELIESTRTIGEGNLEHRVKIRTKNEIAELAVAFNAMTERRQQADERLQYLNSVLRAVRDVNQLITHEEDRDKLLQGACDRLAEARGFDVWIAVFDEAGGFVTSAEAGLGDDFLPMLERLRSGDLPGLCQKAMTQSGILTTDNPAADCPGCPLSGHYSKGAGLIVRLETAGRIYGVMVTSVPPEFMGDPEEHDLLKEVAGDIAFGLRDIELGQKHRKGEEALQRAAKEWETTFNSINDMVSIHDKDYCITKVNESFAAALKMKPEEIVGKKCYEVVHGRNDPFPDCPHGQALETKEPARTEFFDPHLGIYLEVSVSPIFDEQGELAGTVHIASDITDSRRMEEQARQSQKLESIGTLAGGVAHEINNPVMGIMNYSQLILDKLGPDHEVSEFATEIGKETERVSTIVKNLLSFARHEKQTHSPARICDIVEATLSLIRAVIRNDQITLSADVPEDLPKIKCRSQQIQQVLMNLLTNARDALNEKYEGYDENKTVTVTTRILDKNGHQWIRTTVEDHGQGISEEVRERMFDPFYTTKPKDKGTGLGLSISHGIVKDHGGEITVESKIGEWTRFHVDLPIDNGWSNGDAKLGTGNAEGKKTTPHFRVGDGETTGGSL